MNKSKKNHQNQIKIQAKELELRIEHKAETITHDLEEIALHKKSIKLSKKDQAISMDRLRDLETEYEYLFT